MSRARSKAVKCFYFQAFDWTHLELSWADLVTLSPTMLHLVSQILSISISPRLRHLKLHRLQPERHTKKGRSAFLGSDEQAAIPQNSP
jgi:hypothetical protein